MHCRQLFDREQEHDTKYMYHATRTDLTHCSYCGKIGIIRLPRPNKGHMNSKETCN